jgi:single-strand DNA-binding protein
MAVSAVNILPVVGNLTEDPQLVTTQSGAGVVNFTIASTPRRFDRETNTFKDGDALFYRSSVWRKDAENLAASLHKGDRVIAIGEIKPNNYEKDGVKVSGFEFDVHEVAASLAFATVAVTRNPSKGNGAPQAAAPAAPAAPVVAAAPVAAPAVAAPAAPVEDDNDFS